MLFFWNRPYRHSDSVIRPDSLGLGLSVENRDTGRPNLYLTNVYVEVKFNQVQINDWFDLLLLFLSANESLWTFI